MSCVLLVKSYSEELELHQDVDILLLTAAEKILNYADSFFENQVVVEDPEAVDLYTSKVTTWERITSSRPSLIQTNESDGRIYIFRDMLV